MCGVMQEIQPEKSGGKEGSPSTNPNGLRSSPRYPLPIAGAGLPPLQKNTPVQGDAVRRSDLYQQRVGVVSVSRLDCSRGLRAAGAHPDPLPPRHQAMCAAPVSALPDPAVWAGIHPCPMQCTFRDHLSMHAQ